jgi:neutral ceramidase
MDGGTDAGPPKPLSTAHCAYAPLPATAHAGGTVTAGAVSVGLAERALSIPVGVALGGNTSRAAPLEAKGAIDGRRVPLSGSFTPSVGVETIPKVKAVAITAGDETVVLIRTDTIFGDDTITHEVTSRLGPEYAGKVLWMSSHSHTMPGSYSADSKMQVGAGPIRALVRHALIDRMVEAAQAALDARVPAKIGIGTDESFDLDDHVSYDRRPENDFLEGGAPRKDQRLALIRVDALDGTPMAVLPLFGVHSAILDDGVSVFSTDASGAFERAIEEQFDFPVMAIHLQGAGGDVLGESGGHLDYDADTDPRWDFARNEECARYALPAFMAAWERAGAVMQSELKLEMLTRSIAMGPDWRNFTVRGGALSYAPWDDRTRPDRQVFAADGSILSPIDEFNAPRGAGLCGAEVPLLSFARLPGTAGLPAYNSCADMEGATSALGGLLSFSFEPLPLCSTTRATIAALRVGDYLFATAPGEPVVPWRDRVVADSPFPAGHTFVMGYALGHIGYILTPEDWLAGGFEPSINIWGPLEGEHVAEELVELMALAATDAREDATNESADRVVPPTITDADVPPPDPAPLAGTVPDTVPAEIFFRSGFHPTTGQPAASIPRVTGVARFVWIGEDPLSGTPSVVLEREVGGVFAPVTRRSGREVRDLDFVVVWTPQPLARVGTEPLTNYWTIEWQALSPFGAPTATAPAPGAGLDVLADRAGLPLGRYRFHVEGTGYALDSTPFEVVAGTLRVAARREGSAVVVDARFDPHDGWRLMRMTGSANRDLPAEAGPFTVVLEHASSPAETLEGALTAPGTASVTPVSADPITRVVVRDRYGNEGSATLP